MHYVNLETGRIILDLKTIEAPESESDYVAMDEQAFHEYCIEQRRKLDKAKADHKKAEEDFNTAEDIRVAALAEQISNAMGISEEDALSMVQRKPFEEVPNFAVSEKVFGDIVLPEEV